MAWPNLTLVAEGAVTRLVWVPDSGRTLGPIRFASGGDAFVESEDLHHGLAGLIDTVQGRLAEEGLPKTRLAEEWEAVGRASGEESEFCTTVARLGLDPYSVSDQIADVVISTAASIPAELAADFFDSADFTALERAAGWTRRAIPAADRATTRAHIGLERLQDSFPYGVLDRRHGLVSEDQGYRPWATGYAMAREIRSSLRMRNVDQFDIADWWGLATCARSRTGSRDSCL
jgi:hypothetical protein